MHCRVIDGLHRAKIEAEGNSAGLQQMLEAFKNSLVQQDLPGKVAKSVKELHTSVSRLGKVREPQQKLSYSWYDCGMLTSGGLFCTAWARITCDSNQWKLHVET